MSTQLPTSHLGIYTMRGTNRVRLQVREYFKLLLLLPLFSCSGSANSQERPSIPIYEFACRHEAVLAAIAIEPHCGPLPVIHFGITTDGTPHTEAYCEGLGYVRIIGTRIIGVYPTPGVEMTVTHVYEVNEYLQYFFGWTTEEP